MLHLGGGILAHAVSGKVTVNELLMERYLIVLYEQARAAGRVGTASG